MALTEGQYTGEFLLSESPGSLSRDAVTVTVAAATKLSPGRVLAELSATGKHVPYDNVGTDGSEEASAVLYNECDNTDGVAPADFAAVVINWGAEVRKADLSWASGASAGDKTAAYADLAARGIKARD
jgi:hypothetical protein